MPGGHGREVVIVEAVRTPIGRGHKEKGYYKDIHPNELLRRCYTEVIERAGIPAQDVEDVITGCVQQSSRGHASSTRQPSASIP
jgi:acetyl-CoA acyltransferase